MGGHCVQSPGQKRKAVPRALAQSARPLHQARRLDRGRRSHPHGGFPLPSPPPRISPGPVSASSCPSRQGSHALHLTPRRPQSHRELGSAWVEISKRLPGRTDNAIKNRWNSSMRKRYAATGAASPCKRPAPLLNAAPASVLPPSKRIKTEGTLGSSAAPRVPPVGVQGRAAGGGQAVSARPLSSSDQRAKLGSGTTMTLSVVAPRSAPNSHRRRNLQVMFFF